jgi:competence protein ComFB
MTFEYNLKKESPVNLVRIIAEEMLPSVMMKLGVVDTEANREDILAITLNSIPTKYVTTASGKQYAQLVEVYRLQYETDITAELARAAIKVLQKPRGSK